MFSGVVTGDVQSLLETTKHLSHLTTRQQSEDSIHKQLAAFERLLQHSMSRYSNENTYSLLRHITRWVETNTKSSTKNATKVSFKLTSINELQDTIGLMKSKSKLKTPTADEESIYKTFDLFLNDLLYLKDLKKYFDDEIFAALMKYHYEPNVQTSRSTEGNGAMKHIRTIKVEDEDSGNGSQIDADENRIFRKVNNNRKKKSKSPNLSNDDDDKQYKDTVAALRLILKKWDGLLSEDTLDLDDFDPDSYHELMQFSNYTQFETLLRLVPDIFAKCYKSIDLAKTWLRLSNIVMQDEPPSTSSPIIETMDQKMPSEAEFKESEKSTKQFLKEVREIQKQIQDVDKSIGDDVALLHKYYREMDVLVGRDERFSTVSSHMDKIDSLMTIAAGEYQKSKTEQYSIASKLKSCRKGTPTYGELKTNLKKLDNEVAQNHWKIKRLEFERTMYQEDLLVEAEVRPSFIRFIGDTKEKMSDLENLLSVKRDEKLKLEKHLALMKTNTDRMRKIMRTYLGSASTQGDISRESSILSTPDDLSEIPLVDGNEADADSPVPFEDNEQQRIHHKHSTSAHSQKQKLAAKATRPSSERLSETSPKPLTNLGRVSRVGPKAALKTTPRRVWENM
ncbi:uncharacterized protein LOC132740255 isoform X2 [Ruditapes philippinarum]|uniref:uncharacterized protein LOC132740255 isoform X2 n=1 Tax=Ruditapes philippinarum TaxID=129788 RepID=UPI00295AD0F6|nr:uncharacterized protein LOC132740255 isoform X2 [Ruditapes philippinarum]